MMYLPYYQGGVVVKMEYGELINNDSYLTMEYMKEVHYDLQT
jgi:hypothetical protein